MSARGLLLHVLRDIEPPVAHELLARFPCGEAHHSRASSVAAWIPARCSSCRMSIYRLLYVMAMIDSCYRFNGQLPLIAALFLRQDELERSMATSSMESSGSFVVKFCSHMPGAESTRVTMLSCRPTKRLTHR